MFEDDFPFPKVGYVLSWRVLFLGGWNLDVNHQKDVDAFQKISLDFYMFNPSYYLTTEWS